MTVSSLWKALDSSGCGKAVGIAQLVNRVPMDSTLNGYHNEGRTPQTLAVDLSIWICESLTTHGLHERNENPAVTLVFARTVKLLHLGVKLIFVVEGKQRIHDESKKDINTYRKRRSGTSFWKACNDCQQMLEMLGVPVVRAKSEGEALCALLSDRGIVDGVISNDSDCLLFGAKVVYKRYSNENLDNGCVVRYDLNSLQVVVEATDELDNGSEDAGCVTLSRLDLISFALLTGSDLAGKGMKKVGHKKAIRFIYKCQRDNPLSKETASLDELTSWARSATADFSRHSEQKLSSKCCSRCTHDGSKHIHEKNGCVECGTGPGEPCHAITSDDRFRKALRCKAMATKFDPFQILSAYMRPNENLIPVALMTCTNTGVPRLGELMKSTLIVKGRSISESRTFVKDAVLRLLSRLELRGVKDSFAGNVLNNVNKDRMRERPIPKAITKAVTENGVRCFQLVWEIRATTSDENGDGIDGLEYVTVEPQSLIELKYPELLADFQTDEIHRAKQGDGMKQKRREFLEAFKRHHDDMERDCEKEMNKKTRKSGLDKKRESSFENKFTVDGNLRRKNGFRGHCSDEIINLFRSVCQPCQIVKGPPGENSREPPAATSSTLPLSYEALRPTSVANEVVEILPSNPHNDNASTVENDELYCKMGGFDIEISPIEANKGAFPPSHIFLHFDPDM